MRQQEPIARQNHQQQAFWRKMAERYPRPFARKSLADTESIIAIAETAGVTIDKAEILDIGCGTGTYTLPLALRAAQITGIDSSAEMLDICDEEKAAANLVNVQTLLMEWRDVDIDRLDFTRKFDIVWAAMTPAIREAEDLARMRLCARKSCVYVGWGAIRKNELLEKAFAAHNRPFGPPPGAAAIKEMLEEHGLRPQETAVRTYWEWQGPLEEACLNVTGYLKMSGETQIDDETIKSIVLNYGQDDVVRHRTDVEMKVLVWEEK